MFKTLITGWYLVSCLVGVYGAAINTQELRPSPTLLPELPRGGIKLSKRFSREQQFEEIGFQSLPAEEDPLPVDPNGAGADPSSSAADPGATPAPSNDPFTTVLKGPDFTLTLASDGVLTTVAGRTFTVAFSAPTSIPGEPTSTASGESTSSSAATPSDASSSSEATPTPTPDASSSAEAAPTPNAASSSEAVSSSSADPQATPTPSAEATPSADASSAAGAAPTPSDASSSAEAMPSSSADASSSASAPGAEPTGKESESKPSAGAESSTASGSDPSPTPPPSGAADPQATPSGEVFTTTETVDGTPVTIVGVKGPQITLAATGVTTVFAGSTYTVEPPAASSSAVILAREPSFIW